MHSYDRVSFLDSAANGANFIPLAHSWPADLETPLSTWLKVGNDSPPGVLLESVEGGSNKGRYSLLGCDPDLIWSVKDNKASITYLDEDYNYNVSSSPLSSLKDIINI